MDKHENAINYVVQLIKSLDSTAEVEVAQPRPYQYIFCIDIKGQRLTIVFDRSTMDDFEYEITQNKGSDRYYASEGFIKFQVYIALGQAGVISHFDISDEILNEKRDWLQRYSAEFEKPTWLYEIFYQGLKKLSGFLAGLVSQYKILPEEIKEEQDNIIHLVEWYDKHHHFNNDGISESTLGYFKAASVCVILDKEKERKLIKIPRILKAKDQEIYSIISELRENPFSQIKMPDCIYDYASHIKNFNEAENAELSAVSNTSCGPLAKDVCDLEASIEHEFSERNVFLDIPYRNYEDCEEALRDLLAHFDLQPIVAKDRLTSNAVLCKVCKLIKTCKYGITDITSGSNSVSYEYGLMHGLGMKVCLLLRSAGEKFTDIHGLEHLSYDGIRSFKIVVAKWILDNAEGIDVKAIRDFIDKEEEELHQNGEIYLKNINPFFIRKKENSEPRNRTLERHLESLQRRREQYHKLAEHSREFNKLQVPKIRSSYKNLKYFFITATPIPVKEDVIDTDEKVVHDILLSPSYDHYAGWNMGFIDHQTGVQPIFEGVEKKLGDEMNLRLFRNGYLEFSAQVNIRFSWGQDEKEYETSPMFNSYSITEYPVSFLRLVKQVVQQFGLPHSYVFSMGFGDCGLYRLRGYSPESISYLTARHEGKANLDNWFYDKIFDELNMSTDVEAFILVKRLYNTFGHSRDKIPFFTSNKCFEIKK